METENNALAHFGRKGMKWGVRHTREELASTPVHSEDAQRHAESHAKLQQHGARALTTKELQDYVQRMNLEKQLSTLKPGSKGHVVVKAGGKIVGDILLNVGKQQATKLLNDQVSKQLARALAAKA